MKQSFEISVGGQKFVVKSDDGEECVRQIEKLVDQKLIQVQKPGVAATQRAAILAALSIAEDLIALEQAHEALKTAVRDRADKLSEVVQTLRVRKKGAGAAKVRGATAGTAQGSSLELEDGQWNQ